jgi:hypothetical protein
MTWDRQRTGCPVPRVVNLSVVAVHYFTTCSLGKLIGILRSDPTTGASVLSWYRFLYQAMDPSTGQNFIDFFIFCSDFIAWSSAPM